MILKPVKGTLLNHGHPLARGLVGYWLMNEGGGSTVYDISGNGNHGTITGATWAAGKFGSCLYFDGSDDIINWDNSGLQGASECTILLWVAVDASETSGGTLLEEAGGGDDPFLIDIEANELMSYGLWTANGQVEIQNVSDTYFDDKDAEWHQHGIVYDGANIKWIYDGVTGGSTAQTGTIVTNEPGMNTDDDLNGRRDNIMIFDRALSPSEIQSLYRDPFQMFGGLL